MLDRPEMTYQCGSEAILLGDSFYCFRLPYVSSSPMQLSLFSLDHRHRYIYAVEGRVLRPSPTQSFVLLKGWISFCD